MITNDFHKSVEDYADRRAKVIAIKACNLLLDEVGESIFEDKDTAIQRAVLMALYNRVDGELI